MGKRENIYSITNGKCFYCGCELELETFHADHFIPKSSGGKTRKNLVPTCADCNLSKGKLSLEEFREKISRLPFDNHKGRIIAKYHKIDSKPIRFYFEEHGYGYL